MASSLRLPGAYPVLALAALALAACGAADVESSGEYTNLLAERDELAGELDALTASYDDVDDQLAVAAHSLNSRPRQTLNWMTPSQKLAEALQ